MGSKIQREDADETGEYDVSAVRERFTTPVPPPANENSTLTDDEIEDVLFEMVDDGELCFGWIEDRQEFGFWPCENAPGSAPTADEPTVFGAVSRGTSKRRTMAKRHMLVAAVAALAIPLTEGILESTAVSRPDPRSEQVDVTSEMSPMPTGEKRPALTSPATELPGPSAVTVLPGGSDTKNTAEYKIARE